MNIWQKAILLLGGIVLLANLAFPPWELRKPVLYGPVVVARMERRFVMNPPEAGQYHVSGIDWPLLGVTSAAIVVGAGLLFGVTVLFKKPRPN